MGLVIKLIHCAAVVVELISEVTLICFPLRSFVSATERFSYSPRLQAELKAFLLLLKLFQIRGDTFVFGDFFGNFNCLIHREASCEGYKENFKNVTALP